MWCEGRLQGPVQSGAEGEGMRRKGRGRETVEERMSSELGQVETRRQMQNQGEKIWK